MTLATCAAGPSWPRSPGRAHAWVTAQDKLRRLLGQVEQALRDAAEEHLWQIVSLRVVPAENP
jgi:hypothetical protein